jgi:hypothetical protein
VGLHLGRAAWARPSGLVRGRVGPARGRRGYLAWGRKGDLISAPELHSPPAPAGEVPSLPVECGGLGFGAMGFLEDFQASECLFPLRR